MRGKGIRARSVHLDGLVLLAQEFSHTVSVADAGLPLWAVSIVNFIGIQ